VQGYTCPSPLTTTILKVYVNDSDGTYFAIASKLVFIINRQSADVWVSTISLYIYQQGLQRGWELKTKLSLFYLNLVARRTLAFSSLPFDTIICSRALSLMIRHLRVDFAGITGVCVCVCVCLCVCDAGESN